VAEFKPHRPDFAPALCWFLIPAVIPGEGDLDILGVAGSESPPALAWDGPACARAAGRW